MTLSHEMLESMRSVDLGTVDIETLSDASNFRFDNSLSLKERAARMVEHFKNPYCFRYGDMAIKIEFTEGGPFLQDLLTSYLIRQKSGV